MYNILDVFIDTWICLAEESITSLPNTNNKWITWPPYTPSPTGYLCTFGSNNNLIIEWTKFIKHLSCYYIFCLILYCRVIAWVHWPDKNLLNFEIGGLQCRVITTDYIYRVN